MIKKISLLLCSLALTNTVDAMLALRSSQSEVGDHKSDTPQTPLLRAAVSIDIKENATDRTSERLSLLTAALYDHKISETPEQIVIETQTAKPEESEPFYRTY